ETHHSSPPRAGRAVGEQAAFVRALIDEVERHHPEDRRIVPLREQLGDELLQLARLVEGAPSQGEAAGPEVPIDVLVVDAEEAALWARLAVVECLVAPCRSALDGETALREFDREPAASVLSDWAMPGMSGLALCNAPGSFASARTSSRSSASGMGCVAKREGGG